MQFHASLAIFEIMLSNVPQTCYATDDASTYLYPRSENV